MGARGHAPALRRTPTRASAEQIVGAILEAASLLLERDGIEGLTTNAVARVAGVSVGSLYQYFPDKHAIVAELARRVEAAALALTAVEMIRLRDASARETTSRIVSLSCSPAFGTGPLRRALLREVPRGWILRETRSTDATVGDVLTAFFTARADQVKPPAIARAVFVGQHAVEGAVEAVLLAWPDALPTPPVQQELFHLAWSYFAADHEPLARPPIDDEGLLAFPAVHDVAITERLVHEPSRRRSAGRQRKTSARAIATRRAIVEAAERVLARDGFEGVAVRRIAAEAGVALGALYRHFPGAPAVVAEIAVELDRRAVAALEGHLDTARDPRALAQALVGAYLDESLAAAPVRRALLAEVPRRWIEEAAAGVHRSAIERLEQTFRSCSHALRAGEPRVMAFFALHAVKCVAEAFFLLEPSGVARAELREELVELVTRYLTRPLATS